MVASQSAGSSQRGGQIIIPLSHGFAHTTIRVRLQLKLKSTKYSVKEEHKIVSTSAVIYTLSVRSYEYKLCSETLVWHHGKKCSTARSYQSRRIDGEQSGEHHDDDANFPRSRP